MRLSHFLLASGLSLLAEADQSRCKPNFIDAGVHFGLQIVSVEAAHVDSHTTQNFTAATTVSDFCNVTVTYVHNGADDTSHVQVWLPKTKDWNERYLAYGGGGFSAGFGFDLGAGLADGYAVADTDGGHIRFPPRADTWALKGTGTIDYQLYWNYASIALNDTASIAKAVIKSFYGMGPAYSYFSGCSGGGRQGLTLAQRYPKAYDGILANAPALDFSNGAFHIMWPQVLFSKEKFAPPSCELQAIHEAAIEACDELDGVIDGVVSAPWSCKYDARMAIGRPCCEGIRKVSPKSASIANSIWQGPDISGPHPGFGINRDMPFDLSATDPIMRNIGGIAMTKCDDAFEDCVYQPFPMAAQWIQYFVAKDPEFDVTALTEDSWRSLLRQSVQEHQSWMSANWPILDEFNRAGGKMITWHGSSDQLLRINTTIEYYEQVLKYDPDAADYYRLFLAPGVYHCFGGPGHFPHNALQSLTAWVEEGEAPKHLEGTTTQADGSISTRPICSYPKVALYMGGDPFETSSFECEEGYPLEDSDHDEL